MRSHSDHIVVVAGATGNVGPFVVRALLARDATVVMLSRSEDKLAGLCEHLSRYVGESGLARLRGVVGDFSDQSNAAVLRQRITEEVGRPNGVIASVGEFVTTPSLLEASPEDLQRALDGYLIAHFTIARTFLPTLKVSGGTYVLLQGPLAFEPYPQFGTDLISIATAGQHMLFRALAKELDGSPARLVELVNHAFIRDRQTQPGSPLSGEAVGAFTAYLLSGAGEEVHGQSIQLRSPEQLADVGLDTENL